MGNGLTYGLGGRGHWVDMLGADKGKVNAECRKLYGRRTSTALNSAGDF